MQLDEPNSCVNERSCRYKRYSVRKNLNTKRAKDELSDTFTISREKTRESSHNCGGKNATFLISKGHGRVCTRVMFPQIITPLPTKRKDSGVHAQDFRPTLLTRLSGGKMSEIDLSL